MSEPISAEECQSMRAKIEALHCFTCTDHSFCRYCIYQSCREAFDMMGKHTSVTRKYYDGEQIANYAERSRQ